MRITSSDVLVRTLQGESRGQYVFKCPSCGGIVVKDASERIVEILVDAGVKREVFTLPSEMLEHPVDAPVISLDDVLDLALALEDEEEFFRKLSGEQ